MQYLNIMRAFVIYPTYRIIDGEAYVYLFGRLENGESFLTMNKFRPYFYIKNSDLKKAEQVSQGNNLSFLSEIGNLKNFNGDDVVKIIVSIPKQVPPLRQVLEENGIECYEADIRFPYRFMLDNNIKTATDIEGEHKKGAYVSRIYEEPKFKGCEDFSPPLSIMSFDIETDEKFNIFSIAYYFVKSNEKHKKAFIVKDSQVNGAENFKKERDVIIAFLEDIKKYDPDIIMGWNVIDFDLLNIRERCKRHGIPFVLGRADWESKLTIQSDFFRSSSADIAGRQVLDGIDVLRGSFIKLEDYKLETAAKAFLGRSKLHNFDGEDKVETIKKLYLENPESLVEYNILDAELAYDILNKKKLFDLTVQRSLLTGMPLERVNASIASLDYLYISETIKRNIVCPSNIRIESDKRITGGYVKDSTPGIYNYVIVLDYKSLYPSIIRTFNIDPYSFDDDGEIEAPNGARFRNEAGILPMLIQRLWEQRDIAKREKNDVSSLAIKITMNSFFGVLANVNCRFYNLKVANAITYFGRKIVQETANNVEAMGYKVIYSDTDSIFVDISSGSYDECVKAGKKIQDEVNAYYNKFVNETYGRKSFLELEFEKVYKKFLMPKIRGSEKGAKKRYAGIIEKDGVEKLDIVGLEFVRRDWTELAKQFQENLLNKIFAGKEIEKYIKDTVRQLKEGEYDKMLIYRKSIRKSLSEYTKTTPPHVKAARQLDNFKGVIVEYVMTKDGPQPIQKKTSALDYEHYIDKQLKPIAESVLVFYDKNFDDVIKGSSQSSLSDF